MYNNVMFYIHYLYCYTEIYSKLLGTRRKVTFHRNFIILVFIKCNFFVQHSLVYNSLTMERDLAHRIETVNIFTFPQATKKPFQRHQVAHTWLAFTVTLRVMSNGLKYLQCI